MRLWRVVFPLVNRVKLDQSIIGSDEISKLYGSDAPLVFKDEVKTASDTGTK